MNDIIIFLILLGAGYIVGGYLEKRHYKSIRQREIKYISILSIMLKDPISKDSFNNYKLVTGSVVISVDYFKKFMAVLIGFFGGKIEAYETLLDRARREAILRMKEQAQGAKEIINIRIETISISTRSAKSIDAVEILAYGTAIY